MTPIMIVCKTHKKQNHVYGKFNTSNLNKEHISWLWLFAYVLINIFKASVCAKLIATKVNKLDYYTKNNWCVIS